ncbi:stealth family protein [Franconibacter helveticus]|uniref:stealth family protein n=1 Tax=Franconibacter helveticus TaxID=357240 RepID=UPI00290CEBE9|nr:stealth family protein [Franconibacter helveticus]MDU6924746.1 stealth family protein [Franconibacter helveticus]
MKRIYKLLRNPPLFFRDYFNKRYPVIRNELKCPEEEEYILIKNDLILESLMDNHFKIDVVFTWVDNQDPDWQLKFESFKSTTTFSEGEYAKDSARFTNHNELYYSLKSIQKNLSWVNKIYLITDSQKPSWIKQFNNVTIVDHREIIPDCYLPTFNSHVIEAFLHKIPGLNENFIYFNDDVIVARPLPAGHFFKSNGIASLFVALKDLNKMAEKGVDTPTLHASLRSIELLRRYFRSDINNPLVHTYIPLKVSMYKEVWRLYEKEIEGFLIHKFRNNYDLNLATFLVPWFTYLKGHAVQSRDICYYFNVRSPAAKSVYNSLSQEKKEGLYPHSICPNDFNTKTANLKHYDILLKKNLNELIE